MAPVNGKALAAVVAGGVFVWSGIKGWSIVGTIGDLITGVKPNQPTQALVDLTATQGLDPASPAGIGSAGGGDIVSVAMTGIGHAYHFGGAPGTDGSHPWDCSSFVNWVIGVKLGRAIPGYGPGKYRGTVHGPPTGAWAIWNGLQRVSRGNLSAGDIIVWPAHMAIAISNSQCVSALNPKAGTKVTHIEGTGRGPIVTMGRLK